MYYYQNKLDQERHKVPEKSVWKSNRKSTKAKLVIIVVAKFGYIYFASTIYGMK